MSKEEAEVINNDVLSDNTISEHVEHEQEHDSSEDSQGSEADSDGKRVFYQEDIERIVQKRVGREKEEREALQQELERLKSTFRTLGGVQEPQQPSDDAQEFDYSRPITYEDLLALRDQEEKAKRDEHFAQKAAKVTEKFSDFKEKTKSHPFTKAIMSNQNLAKALETLDEPFEFLYVGATNHSKELESIAQISDPNKQFAEIIRLEAKIRQSSSVPGVSQAPGVISDDAESSNAQSTGGDIQSLRKQLLGG